MTGPISPALKLKLLALILFALLSCSKDQDENKGVVLFNGFVSYQTVEDFGATNKEFNKTANQGDEALVIFTSDKHPNVKGTISISFFEDRLFSVLIYPDDCDLRHTYKKGRNEFVETITSVNQKGRCYKDFLDIRIQEEFDYFVD